MRNRWLRLDPVDNVAVVVGQSGMQRGDKIGEIKCLQSIPLGHKVALASIGKGMPIYKLGQIIGEAKCAIHPGEHVHTQNIAPTRVSFKLDHQTSKKWDRKKADHFDGYRRKNGSVGVRNYVVVVASVNCSASVVKAVCRQVEPFMPPQLHGVIPVTHQSGCAQAVGGKSFQLLNRTLAGWVFHPNVVGAVVIGLGCEGTTLETILERAPKEGADLPILKVNIQDIGGTQKAIEHGSQEVRNLFDCLPDLERTPCPVSSLKLALNCGGSDAFSAITANPLLGSCSDRLVSQGGTVVLAEIPECTGAREMLLQRSVSDSVGKKLNQVFDWWKDYAGRHGVSPNENLAPGNMAGGISTIVEKSLGAVAKAGGSPLVEVVGYGERTTQQGFVLMDTPGFDPVSVTGLVAGGCQMVAFTTGRGSVYGCAIAPTIKITTQTALYERMSGDMDFDGGQVLGEASFSNVTDKLYDQILSVASGQATQSEALGMGWEEFAPWPIGETL